MVHEGVQQVFHMVLLKKHKTAFARQVSEGVEIEWCEADLVLNQKGEWNSAPIPKMAVEVRDKVRLAESKRGRSNGVADLRPPKRLRAEPVPEPATASEVKAETCKGDQGGLGGGERSYHAPPLTSQPPPPSPNPPTNLPTKSLEMPEIGDYHNSRLQQQATKLDRGRKVKRETERMRARGLGSELID